MFTPFYESLCKFSSLKNLICKTVPHRISKIVKIAQFPPPKANSCQKTHSTTTPLIL